MFSGLNRPMAGRSLTSAHTDSGGAETSVLRLIRREGESAVVMSGTLVAWQQERIGPDGSRGAAWKDRLVRRPRRDLRPLAALTLATLAMTGCGDGGSTVTTPPAAAPSSATATVPTAASPATVPPPPSAVASGVPSPDVDQTITRAVTGGKVAGGSVRVPVKLGSTVRLVVTSDVSDELHLHVYDVKEPVTPGRPSEIVFTADVPGQIELDLEGARLTVVRLVIS